MPLMIKAQGRDKTTIQVVMAANAHRRKDLDSSKSSQKSQASPGVEEEPSLNMDTFLNRGHEKEWEVIYT